MPKPAFSTTFGLVVRSHRDAANLTQEELAERAKIHPTYVGLVERGRRNPSLDVAARIAEALSVTLTELVSEAEKHIGRQNQVEAGRKKV